MVKNKNLKLRRLSVRHFLDVLDDISLVMTLVIIPMVAFEFFVGVSVELKSFFEYYYVLIYALFAAEFFLRLFFSSSKKVYLKHNWIQFVIIIFPFFRVLQVAPILEGVFLIVIERVTKRFLRPHHYSVINLFIFLLIIVFLAAELIVFLEHPYPQSQIKTVSDALWWSAVGVSTIGIGNIVPTSPLGKVLTLVLMIVGVFFWALVTASITTYFAEEDIRKDLNEDVNRLEGDLNKVEKDVEGEVRVDDKHVEEKVAELEKRLNAVEKSKKHAAA